MHWSEIENKISAVLLGNDLHGEIVYRFVKMVYLITKMSAPK